MDVELRPEAIDDISSSADFFNEKSDGWGNHFVRSIELDLSALENEAGIHAAHFGLPCKFSKTFPFAIYYRIEGALAMVYAILSCRLSPDAHQSILDGRRSRHGE